MYDTVTAEHPCWNCGDILDQWQTKRRIDGQSAGLETLDVDQVAEYYTSCDGCGAWNEYRRPYADRFIPDHVEPSDRHNPNSGVWRVGPWPVEQRHGLLARVWWWMRALVSLPIETHRAIVEHTRIPDPEGDPNEVRGGPEAHPSPGDRSVDPRVRTDGPSR